MALFKKRASPSSQDDTGSGADTAPSYVDPVRRRARHRLIGATILVIAAVLGLPWLFDAKPPVVAQNVPISIGEQATTVAAADPAPVPVTPAPAPIAHTAPAPTPAVPPSAAPPAPAPKEPEEKPQPQPAAVAEPVPTAKPEAPAKPAPAPPKPVATQKAPGNLDELIAQRQAQEQTARPAAEKPKATAKPAATPKPAEEGRFVVQVGAYADAATVASVRQRLGKAGLNSYTQNVTANGKPVTRVRLGPFATRAQMDQAAAKVRALGLPVSTYQL
ncbi:MAG: SPOR domain-containing protein [Brachymonas sp.]|nr:SPOR domain-containing protein [Brachymonas sp.]